ncbi:MAG: hypothetical protein V1701_06905 [Planctomycetota bacterium]
MLPIFSKCTIEKKLGEGGMGPAYNTSVMRYIVFLILLLILGSSVRADEITTADKRKLVGSIVPDSENADEVTILTYKDGPITVQVSDIVRRTAGKTLYDDYNLKKGEYEDTAEGHFKLGQWCKDKGLAWQARQEWRKTVELDAEHEAARKALGDKKVKDKWVTYESEQESKGLMFFEGKWLKPDEIDKIKRTRHPAYGWVLTAAYIGDADKAFLESWGERAKEASSFMWELTEGQMYVEQVTITDKGGPADFTIVNKDSMKAKPGAYYAITLEYTIEAPGQILAYTFFHELIHFKYKRHGHCENCKHCIMSSDPGASKLCDDADHKDPPETSCWGFMRQYHNKNIFALQPLARKWKPTKLPETKIIIKDR